MKKILAIFTIFATGLVAIAENPREVFWENTLNSIRETPKKSIESLDDLIKRAEDAQAWDEYVLAVVLRAKAIAEIEGRDGNAATIKALQSASKESPNPETRAFIDAQLARAFVSYANAFDFGRIKAETPIDNPDKEATTQPIETWSRERLLNAANEIYTKIFEDADTLKKIPISAFLAKIPENDSLKKSLTRYGFGNKSLGIISLNNSTTAEFPTLYDFFAQDAIKFYQRYRNPWEDNDDIPENAFTQLPADSALLASTEEFLQYVPATSHTSSPLFLQLKILKSWENFHERDAEKSAIARARLTRILWAYGNMERNEQNTLTYRAALKNFSEEFSYFPIAAEADAALAQSWLDEENTIEAAIIAQESYKKHKGKPNAANLSDILKTLESKHIGEIKTKYVWPDQESATIEIQSKNISKIYFRAVRWDWNDFLRRERNRPQNLSSREREEILLKKEGAIEWIQEIDTHNDYKKHKYSVPAPLEKMEPGFYFIVASARNDFSLKDNDFSYSTVWVSNLALVFETIKTKTTKFSGRVLNATTGDPIEGVNVTAWNRLYGGERSALPPVKTNKDGYFEITGVKENFIALATSSDGNAIDVSPYISFQGHAQKPKTDRSIIFTDRAIYRPGQSIQFKGIIASFDAAKFASEKIIPGEKITAKLFDTNGREVEKIDCYSNAFGSFAGTFTAPINSLPGRYKISFRETSKWIYIEEYKRPKFDAEIQLPKEELILGGNANFTISANSFTGTPLNGAKVEWKVESPKAYKTNGKKYKNHGTGTLDTSGNLKISFPTETLKLLGDDDFYGDEKPSAEKLLDAEKKLVRDFFISATITDSNGETRNVNTILEIGNSSLEISFSKEKNIFTTNEIPKLNLAARTHTGTLKSVPVKIEIFKCDLPKQTEEITDQNIEKKTTRGERVFEKSLETKNDKPVSIALKKLPAGSYIAVVSGKDSFEKSFEDSEILRVIDPAGTKYPAKEAFLCEAIPPKKGPLSPYEIGETYTLFWGSGCETARAYVEIFYKSKAIKSFWTDIGKTQQTITVPVTPDLAGGFVVRVSQVRDNVFNNKTARVLVAPPNKELKLSWEKFRTNLIPGGAEIWTARIVDKNGIPVKAEMVATLYDKSLDMFATNKFTNFDLPAFDYESNRQIAPLVDTCKEHYMRTIARNFWKSPYNSSQFTQISWAFNEYYSHVRPRAYGMISAKAMRADVVNDFSETDESLIAKSASEVATTTTGISDNDGAEETLKPTSDKNTPIVSPRKNLQETAFFYPFLNTDANGVVTISFVVPEALTTWRFQAFAHDEKLRSGILAEDNIITSKDLMVQPNAPRFLREGDEIFFPVKITNSGKTDLTGTAKLAFANIETSADMSAQLGIAGGQEFSVPANSSKTLLWKIRVPADCPFLSYRATATAGTLSDGEENFLPVLSKKITITESVNVPVRGNAKKEITFEKLRAGTDASLVSRAFSIRTNPNPGIDVFLALPSLEEKCNENESSDSIFFRYYTNALAEKIATSNPELQNLFKRWRETPALESPLAKNTELKQLALEETSYWNDAQDETAQRRAIGKFFDKNRVEFEKTRALNELRERLEACHGNGWSWFPGRDEANDFITQNIVCGFARLRQMGIETDMSLPMRAIPAQDKWLGKRFDNFDDDGKRVPAGIDSLLAGYLYTRSFYQKEIPQSRKDAWEYYLAQAKNPESWLALPRMSQAHIALALFQVGGDENIAVAKRIAESIKQHATQTEELGAFWKDERTLPWWCWNYAPTETQAMMVELFERIAGDKAFAEEIRINLLTQKQATIWRSTRATADAIWAFSAGKEKQNTSIVSAQPLNISTGTQKIELEQTASLGINGTRERTFIGSEIVPALGKISIENPNKTIAWASASWTFSQDIDTVSAHEQSAMKIRKTLWKKSLRPDGTSALFPARGEILEPGDELLVRLTIETDRDFDFVHMKDYRGSGTEPTNTLSGYRWNNGVWYYEATRDTGTHFFFDKLPAGTHVFEYSLRIQQRGKYTGGITELRSLYAPEFNAHSSATNISTR